MLHDTRTGTLLRCDRCVEPTTQYSPCTVCCTSIFRLQGCYHPIGCLHTNMRRTVASHPDHALDVYGYDQPSTSYPLCRRLTRDESRRLGFAWWLCFTPTHLPRKRLPYDITGIGTRPFTLSSPSPFVGSFCEAESTVGSHRLTRSLTIFQSKTYHEISPCLVPPRLTAGAMASFRDLTVLPGTRTRFITHTIPEIKVTPWVKNIRGVFQTLGKLYKYRSITI
jgi:hypothetical protein